MRKGQITLNLNAEFRKIIKDNFNTDDETEIKQLILKFLENPDIETLSLKDQMLIERITSYKALRPLQKRKLELQNQLLEKQVNFVEYFKKPISESGSRQLTKSYSSEFGFATSQNVDENIQIKKNFFIDKHSDGSFVSVCKVCQNFTTSVCSTSKEAEREIEDHLDIVHQKELFQR